MSTMPTMSDSRMLESLTQSIRQWESQIGCILEASDEEAIRSLGHMRAQMNQILESMARLRSRQTVQSKPSGS